MAKRAQNRLLTSFGGCIIWQPIGRPAKTRRVGMNKKNAVIVLAALVFVEIALLDRVATGQAPTATAPQPMSFFVTSRGIGDGGNLAGLVGADYHCQQLAQAVGSTKTFHAYLSAQSFTGGMVSVNARDRIGKGPWYNADGQLIARNVQEL